MSAIDTIKNNSKVFVKFGYKGCPPCKKLDEMISLNPQLFAGVKVLKGDVSDRRGQDDAEQREQKDAYEKIMETFCIEDFHTVPQILLFTNGLPDDIHKHNGKIEAMQPNVHKPKEFVDLISAWKSR